MGRKSKLSRYHPSWHVHAHFEIPITVDIRETLLTPSSPKLRGGFHPFVRTGLAPSPAR